MTRSNPNSPAPAATAGGATDSADTRGAFDDWYASRTPSSREAFRRASEVLPGGVGSSARGTRAGWTPYPLFLASGRGSHVWDADGNEFVDYLLGLGPMLLGHVPRAVTEAVSGA